MTEITKENVIEFIENMSVLELSEMIKDIEEKFGVSASQPVAMAVPGVSEETKEEEKTSFDVLLTSSGDKKIAVIKEVRSITGLGLKEAKQLVDDIPNTVKEGLSEEEAEKIKSQLESVGAQVELK